MTNQLTGKVAIVTGASSGIGEAAAIALAAAGAKVAIAARRADRLDTVAQKIQATGGEALTIVADVADESQVQAMVQQTQERWGQVDILINRVLCGAVGEVGRGNGDCNG